MSQLAYHMLREDMKSTNGELGPWHVGQTRRCRAKYIAICNNGFHSCPTLEAQSQFIYGPMLCLVKVSNPVEYDTDGRGRSRKQVSRQRTLLVAWDVTKQIEEWGDNCLRHVYHEKLGDKYKQWHNACGSGSFSPNAWETISRAKEKTNIARDQAYRIGLYNASGGIGYKDAIAAEDAEYIWQQEEFARLMKPVIDSYQTTYKPRTC